MNLFRLERRFFFVMLIVACDENKPKSGQRKLMNAKNDVVVFHGNIVKFTENAMSDSFDDGSFQQFDAVTIEVKEPAAYKSMNITVYVEREEAANERYRRIGAPISFGLSKDALESDSVIFWGALTNVSFDM